MYTPICKSLTAFCFLSVLLPVEPVRAQQRRTPENWQVFAFCHDTHDARKRDVAEQAAMLKQLGFDGAGHIGLERIDQRLDSLDKVGLQLFLAGITINLAQDIDPQLQPLREALPVLKGRRLLLYTVVTGLPPGSPQGTEKAVAAVRRLCDIARTADLRIALYPHTGDWIATVPQAIALAKRVDRVNCGVVFNLCHFLRNEEPDSLDEVLRAAAPYLMAVTLNGADLAGRSDKDWKRLIQPLDQGNFDLTRLLRTLKQLDYQGPIGIMCYGIGGDAREHLGRSIRKWRELMSDR